MNNYLMGSQIRTNDLSLLSTTSSYHLASYDLDKKGFELHFKEKVHTDLLCNLCNLPLRLPKQSPCGCRYCAACIKRHVEELQQSKEQFNCPSCNEVVPSVEMVPDYRVKKQLDRRIVYCPNSTEGCQAEFPLKQLVAHVDVCDFTMVKCPNASDGCVASMRRRDEKAHVMIDCAFRLGQCEHCRERFQILKIAEHTMTCRFVPKQCPNHCGKTIPRAKMADHITNDCEMGLRQCKFADQGCEFKGVKCDLDKHMADSMSKHLDMMVVETTQLRLKDAQSQRHIADVENQNSILQGKQEVQSKELEELRQKCEGNSTNMQAIQGSLSIQLEKFNTFEHKLKSAAAIDDVKDVKLLIGPLQKHVRSLRDKIKEIESGSGARGSGAATGPSTSGHQLHNIHSRLTQMNKEIGLHAARLAEQDIRIQIAECVGYDGVLLWKINDFERRMNEARTKKNYSLYSQPFYTSRFGYKMCARVYLNGDGIGSGTHMSLFFVIMKGEYDALLPWPFRQKVTMILLDQSSGRRHLTDSFTPNPQSSSFQLPVNDMNIASGCPQFVAQETLTSQTYCKDNTMYIKMIVDIPDPCL